MLRHGLTPLAGRNAAIVMLAAELPASVLADLIGIHEATATRWARRANRDWHTYLAHRRSEQPAAAERPRRGPRLITPATTQRQSLRADGSGMAPHLQGVGVVAEPRWNQVGCFRDLDASGGDTEEPAR